MEPYVQALIQARASVESSRKELAERTAKEKSVFHFFVDKKRAECRCENAYFASGWNEIDVNSFFRGLQSGECGNFSGVDFSGYGPGANGWDFRGAKMIRATMSGSATVLTGSKFWCAKMSMADLSGAQLMKADFHHAEMNDVILEGANLQGADFRGASLGHARLQNTDLRGAHLERIDADQIDLRGADLRGAILDETSVLSGAVYSETTRWPFTDEELKRKVENFKMALKADDTPPADPKARWWER